MEAAGLRDPRFNGAACYCRIEVELSAMSIAVQTHIIFYREALVAVRTAHEIPGHSGQPNKR